MGKAVPPLLSEMIAALSKYDFPRNFRELINAVNERLYSAMTDSFAFSVFRCRKYSRDQLTL